MQPLPAGRTYGPVMPDEVALTVLNPPLANLKTTVTEEETIELTRFQRTAEGYQEERLTVTRRSVRYSHF